MLSGIVTLLSFTVAGNVISESLHLPIPGAVIGLILLMLYLQLRDEVPAPVEKVSQFCIRYLSVLFIPASVGIFFMTDLLAAQWLPISLALLVATPVSLVLTALIMQGLLKYFARENK